MRWLLAVLALAAQPAMAQTCRSDAGFLYKLTTAQARGQEAFVGVGRIVPDEPLPEPARPVGLHPETGEIVPSSRPGPVSARYLFTGDLHGAKGRRRIDDLPITLSVGCVGFTCAVFPGTAADPMAAYFVMTRGDGGLHVDGGPCKGFSRTLTEARSAALIACAEAGGCAPDDWAAFCDRQSHTPMHVCISAGLLVRDPKTGRFVPAQR